MLLHAVIGHGVVYEVQHVEALLAEVPAEADRQQEHPEMCYTSRAIRHEQVVRLRGEAIPGDLAMPIQDLHVTNIGPFDDMTFAFDEHINVFVGPNSSGKSTTLMTLANIVTYPFTLPRRLCKTAPAAFTLHIIGRDGQLRELTGVLPLDQEALAYQSRWATILTTLGYSAFVPALRQNTGFRSSGARAESQWRETSQFPEELRLRRSLLPTDAALIRAEAVLEHMVEFADRAVRRNDPAMRRLLTQ